VCVCVIVCDCVCVCVCVCVCIYIFIYRYTLGIVVGVGAGLHYSTIHELELTAGKVEILCDFDNKTGQRITRVNRIEKVGKFPATRPGKILFLFLMMKEFLPPPFSHKSRHTKNFEKSRL
jgi:hypothetical protein